MSSWPSIVNEVRFMSAEEGLRMSVQRSSASFERARRNYWEYYLQLEDEFIATRRYVAFHTSNSKTFSLEFLKLYEAICGEIDTIGKGMVAYTNPSFKGTDRSINIYIWWYKWGCG